MAAQNKSEAWYIGKDSPHKVRDLLRGSLSLQLCTDGMQHFKQNEPVYVQVSISAVNNKSLCTHLRNRPGTVWKL